MWILIYLNLQTKSVDSGCITVVIFTIYGVARGHGWGRMENFVFCHRVNLLCRVAILSLSLRGRWRRRGDRDILVVEVELIMVELLHDVGPITINLMSICLVKQWWGNIPFHQGQFVEDQHTENSPYLHAESGGQPIPQIFSIPNIECTVQ